MPHLIETIGNCSITHAAVQLKASHQLIVESTIQAQLSLSSCPDQWGSQLKRMEITLPEGQAKIGKRSEKFTEIINILATTERTIAALNWFASTYPESHVRECHASTSDFTEGNDIVLIDNSDSIVVRCEVTDVISSSAGQNGKEKKDLKNLGCSALVPDDGIDRYIATSPEFAAALSSPSRKWASYHYLYERHKTNAQDQTTLLLVKPSN